MTKAQLEAAVETLMAQNAVLTAKSGVTADPMVPELTMPTVSSSWLKNTELTLKIKDIGNYREATARKTGFWVYDSATENPATKGGFHVLDTHGPNGKTYAVMLKVMEITKPRA